MSNTLKDKCAIVGIGETKFGKIPGVSGMSLILEACKKAIEDSGMKKDEVDGLIGQQPMFDPTFMYSTWIAENLGIKNLNFTTDLNIGGATPVLMVTVAAMAIDAGLCNAVVCVFGENIRTAHLTPKHGKLKWGGEDFENPFGMPMPGPGYAMACRRHMYEYGTTHEQLGAIAVAMRKHASLNETAQMRDPITLEDYLNSPWYYHPFRLLDICLMSDGACAVLVTSAERARDLKHNPAYIMGFGSHHIHRFIASADTLTETGAKISGERAFKMAGITVKDIDFAELYDCFTYTLLVQLEDYGFCKKGEGGPFVEDGRIEIGGELPVNTHGGLLSHAHIDGFNHITEAVKQLRGNCGERQVKNAEICLVSGNGGILDTHTTLILRR
jgi:acetyl-CoA acetyltransferase